MSNRMNIEEFLKKYPGTYRSASIRNENGLIDKNEFAKILYENIRNDNLRIYAEVCNILKDMPTVDAIEVVRCKDCKHRDPEDKKCDCGNLHHAGTIFPVPENHFCADGERRTE